MMAVETLQMKFKVNVVDTDRVLSVLDGGDPLGYTADEITDALHLPLDSAIVQHDLEAMVDYGLLDRHGIGRGALYRPAETAGTFGAAVPDSVPVKKPMAQKAG